MILEIFLLVVGVGVLYLGAEWLVQGSARLAARLGVSPIVVGLTVVSLGTSAPEMVVCVLAALEGSGDLAVGNVLGSNLANIGLILGLSAAVRPLTLAARVLKREVPIMLLVTLLLYPLILDLELGRTDGTILLVVLALYLLFVGWTAGENPPPELEEIEELEEVEDPDEGEAPVPGVLGDVGRVVIGSAGVILGGELIVDNAIILARTAGIPELAVGLTVVAVGTSLPELATSVVAAVRDESDIAVGNIIGSNIFNVAAVLGVASVLQPISVAASVLTRELPAVLAMSVMILVIAAIGLAIRRWEGLILLGSYVATGFWVFM